MREGSFARYARRCEENTSEEDDLPEHVPALMCSEIIELREKVGLDYDTFADMVGAQDGSMVKKWETGELTPKKINYHMMNQLRASGISWGKR